MINYKSIDHVRNRKKWRGLTFPDYQYNYLNFVKSIPYLFSRSCKAPLPLDTLSKTLKYDHVILILADGFGWSQFIKNRNHQTIKLFEKQGIVSLLTSLFPSTTAAHITSLHTGTSVGEHGIYEWNCYNQALNDIIQPLVFSGSIPPHSLNNIYPDINTLYAKLKHKNIQSKIFMPTPYCTSQYSQWATRGANCVGYSKVTEAFQNIPLSLGIQEKLYSMVYFEDIDTMGHQYGPDSSQTQKAINQLLNVIFDFVSSYRSGNTSNKTLLLLTADHGQIQSNKNVYINQKIPDLVQYITKNRNGKLLVPAGSSRDLFLHVDETKIDEVIRLIKGNLGPEFVVYPTKDVIEQGLFGNTISDTFLNSVGNIVILPIDDSSIWWNDPSQNMNKHIGNHGGLSKEELEIPLVSLEL